MYTIITILALAITLHIIFREKITEYAGDWDDHIMLSVASYLALLLCSGLLAIYFTEGIVDVKTVEYPLVKTENKYFNKSEDKYGNPYFSYAWAYGNNVNINMTRTLVQSDKAVVVVRITTPKLGNWGISSSQSVEIVEVHAPLEYIVNERVAELKQQ